MHPTDLLKKLSTILILAYTCNSVVAESNPDPSDEAESNWDIAIAIGYGQRSNPILFADDINLAVDLNIAWYGKRWFFDNGDIGFTLSDSEHSTINIAGRINSDRVFFQKTDTDYVIISGTTLGQGGSEFVLASDTLPLGQEEFYEPFTLPKRNYAFELGLELLSEYNWGNIHADTYIDASDTHNGMQFSLHYSYDFQFKRWYFQPGVGFSWKNNNLNDYYWGVRETEANLAIPVYQAGSGINPNARLLLAYQLNKKWAWITAIDYEGLSTPIKNSPFVMESDVIGFYSGFRYKF